MFSVLTTLIQQWLQPVLYCIIVVGQLNVRDVHFPRRNDICFCIT